MLCRHWYAVSAAAILMGAAGCPGAAGTPVSRMAEPTAEIEEVHGPVHKRGDDKLTAGVGTAGGTLRLANGALLDIPEGALEGTVQITFSEGTHTTAFANHEYERPVGPTLEVGPPLNLRRPCVVSVPLPALPEGFEAKDLTLATEVMSDTQRAVPMQGTQTRWDYSPATSAAGRARAEVPQVPGFRIQFVVSRGN